MSDRNYVSNERRITVRQYGLLAPVDWGSDCDDEMRKAKEFWNRLVEIEAQFREEYRRIINDDSQLIGLRAQIDRLVEARESFELKENTSGDPHSEHSIRASIKDLNKKITSLSKEVKARRLSLKKEKKQQIDANEMSRREAVRLARQDNELWWQTADLIYMRYSDARQRVMKDGVELRFQPLDSDNIQIVNRDRRDFGIADIFEGKGMFSLTPLPPNAFTHKSKGERRRLQRTLLTLCVYSRNRQPRLVSWPMQMHRPIPDDCTIKYVTVTRRKEGPRAEWKATFTCYREPERVRIAAPASVATISFDPHRADDGIRVGQLTSRAGESRWITLPERELGRFDHAGKLIAARRANCAGMMAALAGLRWAEAPEQLLVLWTQIKGAPVSSQRLVNLLGVWAAGGWQNDMRLRLEEWARMDLRNWREITGLRLHLRRARLDHYRKIAHDIVLNHGTIILGDLPHQGRADPENAAEEAMLRHLAQVTAPGLLRQTLLLAARAHHRSVVGAEEDRLLSLAQ